MHYIPLEKPPQNGIADKIACKCRLVFGHGCRWASTCRIKLHGIMSFQRYAHFSCHTLLPKCVFFTFKQSLHNSYSKHTNQRQKYRHNQEPIVGTSGHNFIPHQRNHQHPVTVHFIAVFALF